MSSYNTLIPYLKNAGFSSFLDIQSSTIDAYRKHSSVVLYSQTGSGKTIAFLSAIIDSIDASKNHTQALIICPTRELAIQIGDVLKSMRTNCLHTTCYGGHSIKTEENNLSANPLIVIGTPGRLADHIERENLQLDDCKNLVIDEFDKCLELGFNNDMEFITSYLEESYNRILVSATKIESFPNFIGSENHHFIDKIEDSDVSNIQEFGVKIQEDAFHTLFLLTKSIAHEKTIVFCNYREVCEDVSARLNKLGHYSITYHGGLDQDDREKAIIQFKNGSNNILVCTDLASRGIDIDDVKHVIHYQYPNSKEAFTHRIGRTGRMNKQGASYILIGKTIQLPEYMTVPDDFHEIKEVMEISRPKWNTLYIGGGKKNKINKIDIVGFLSRQSPLENNEIGVIIVKDKASFAAINADKTKEVIDEIQGKKIKNQKVKFALAK